MDHRRDSRSSPTSSSGAATPTSASPSSSFLSSSFYNAFGGLMRRLSSDPAGLQPSLSSSAPSPYHPRAAAAASSSSHYPHAVSKSIDGLHVPGPPPPLPSAAAADPPPLEPVALRGFDNETPASARLLTAGVAEEIRIMVPERLRIEDGWQLVYSLDQDGASLATLYQKCAAYQGRRGGFVLVVRDIEGGTFGAYLTEAPHPSPHYFGTGECFLWRASLLVSLPPPPSSDTTGLAGRTTTIAAPSPLDASFPPLIPHLAAQGTANTATTATLSTQPTQESPGPSTPSFMSPTPASSTSALPVPPDSPSIRFKAFPYSGVNEYFVYCEPLCLSVGGGDGKYGLWLDDSLERGVSSTCLTFGNEPLSDEGEKFRVLGVEVWAIGAKTS